MHDEIKCLLAANPSGQAEMTGRNHSRVSRRSITRAPGWTGKVSIAIIRGAEFKCRPTLFSVSVSGSSQDVTQLTSYERIAFRIGLVRTRSLVLLCVHPP